MYMSITSLPLLLHTMTNGFVLPGGVAEGAVEGFLSAAPAVLHASGVADESPVTVQTKRSLEPSGELCMPIFYCSSAPRTAWPIHDVYIYTVVYDIGKVIF